ncbi:MAG: hypothetical protein WBA23_00305 [Tunicatimonas sp.]|uniref:hypothetical protein n=1 Tax=Tunicatimonas sp. TaxID=1940096 RepID=UPI003C76FD2E
MKAIVGVLSIVLGLFLNVSLANAQCDPSVHTEACIPQLADGFNFVKSYEVNGEGGTKEKVEYSYVFAKGTQYFLNICAAGDQTDGIIVSLYDSNRKKVGTSFANGNFNKGIIYPCNATGIYYITFTFDGSQNHCGGAVLGFKR